MATAELVQLAVVFRTIDMFIHLINHINIYWDHEANSNIGYMRARPVLHGAENEAEAKTYEAEAEATKLASRQHWPRRLNILPLTPYLSMESNASDITYSVKLSNSWTAGPGSQSTSNL